MLECHGIQASSMIKNECVGSWKQILHKIKTEINLFFFWHSLYQTPYTSSTQSHPFILCQRNSNVNVISKVWNLQRIIHFLMVGYSWDCCHEIKFAFNLNCNFIRWILSSIIFIMISTDDENNGNVSLIACEIESRHRSPRKHIFALLSFLLLIQDIDSPRSSEAKRIESTPYKFAYAKIDSLSCNKIWFGFLISSVATADSAVADAILYIAVLADTTDPKRITEWLWLFCHNKIQ